MSLKEIKTMDFSKQITLPDEETLIRILREEVELHGALLIDFGYSGLREWLTKLREYCYRTNYYLGVDAKDGRILLRALGWGGKRSNAHIAWIRDKKLDDGTTKSRMHIYLPQELFNRIDAHIKRFGFRSRNVWLQRIAELALAKESLNVREEWGLCPDCWAASKDPRALHCGKPGHVYRNEPDKHWNNDCAVGQERTVDHRCDCEDCGEPVPGVDTPSEAE